MMAAEDDGEDAVLEVVVPAELECAQAPATTVARWATSGVAGKRPNDYTQ
jgi:hypothetical protein